LSEVFVFGLQTKTYFKMHGREAEMVGEKKRVNVGEQTRETSEPGKTEKRVVWSRSRGGQGQHDKLTCECIIALIPCITAIHRGEWIVRPDTLYHTHIYTSGTETTFETRWA
jgi:hypothetical protein